MPYEYGYRSNESTEDAVAGSITWPDEDGELRLYDGAHQFGYIKADGQGDREPSPEEIEQMHRAAAHEGAVLVRRVVGPVEVVPGG